MTVTGLLTSSLTFTQGFPVPRAPVSGLLLPSDATKVIPINVWENPVSAVQRGNTNPNVRMERSHNLGSSILDEILFTDLLTVKNNMAKNNVVPMVATIK